MKSIFYLLCLALLAISFTSADLITADQVDTPAGRLNLTVVTSAHSILAKGMPLQPQDDEESGEEGSEEGSEESSASSSFSNSFYEFFFSSQGFPSWRMSRFSPVLGFPENEESSEESGDDVLLFPSSPATAVFSFRFGVRHLVEVTNIIDNDNEESGEEESGEETSEELETPPCITNSSRIWNIVSLINVGDWSELTESIQQLVGSDNSTVILRTYETFIIRNDTTIKFRFWLAEAPVVYNQTVVLSPDRVRIDLELNNWRMMNNESNDSTIVVLGVFTSATDVIEREEENGYPEFVLNKKAEMNWAGSIVADLQNLTMRAELIDFDFIKRLENFVQVVGDSNNFTSTSEAFQQGVAFCFTPVNPAQNYAWSPYIALLNNASSDDNSSVSASATGITGGIFTSTGSATAEPTLTGLSGLFNDSVSLSPSSTGPDFNQGDGTLSDTGLSGLFNGSLSTTGSSTGGDIGDTGGDSSGAADAHVVDLCVVLLAVAALFTLQN